MRTWGHCKRPLRPSRPATLNRVDAWRGGAAAAEERGLFAQTSAAVCAGSGHAARGAATILVTLAPVSVGPCSAWATVVIVTAAGVARVERFIASYAARTFLSGACVAPPGGRLAAASGPPRPRSVHRGPFGSSVADAGARRPSLATSASSGRGARFAPGRSGVASLGCCCVAPCVCSSFSAIRLPRTGLHPPEDRYANVFWVQRRKCLLVTHAGTLFSVFAPAVAAADLRPLGAFVAPLITHQLVAERSPPPRSGHRTPPKRRSPGPPSANCSAE